MIRTKQTIIMKIQLSILIVLLFNFSIYGQQNIGIKANGGLSRIFIYDNSTQQIVQKSYFVPSGQGGLFYNLPLGNKSLLGSELLFVQIEGKERIEIPFTDQLGNPTGEFGIDNIDRHISYIGLPIYYGFKVKKLILNLGIQTSFTLVSSAREKGQSPDGYGGINTWDNKSDKLNIDAFDFGARAGLIFNLTNRFAVEGTYYYGINNILKKNIYNTELKWKIQQMTIGLRYTLFTIKKKGDKEI